MKRIKHIASITLLLGTLFILMSCNKEEITPAPEGTDKNAGEVVLSVQVSGKLTSSFNTRNIPEGGVADNEVTELDILIFNSNGDYVRRFYTENLESVGGNLKQTRLRLPVGSYFMVALANSHDIVEAQAGNLTEGATKEQIMPLFKYTTPSFGQIWNPVTSSAKYRPFPMWGETNGTVEVSENGTQAITLSLVRMLTKINLKVNYTVGDDGQKDFQLTSVRVYNYNKDGYVAPSPENWVTEPKKATELLSKETGTNKTPLVYDNYNLADDGKPYNFVDSENNQIIDEIFLFESKAGSVDNSDSNTCLVIGGYYKGEMNFYRLDFIQEEGYIDLVRNKGYTIEVAEVKQAGMKFAEAALDYGPSNISYTVTPDKENLEGDIIVEGETQLIVSPTSYRTIGKEGTYLEFDIYTNFAGASGMNPGWQIALNKSGDRMIVDENENLIDWIVNRGSNGIGYPGNGQLQLSVEPNSEGKTRKGYVHIVSGKLRHKIEITQTAEISKPTLTIDQSDFIFNRAGERYIYDPISSTGSWEPRKTSHWAYATWTPSSLECRVKVEHINGGFSGTFPDEIITSSIGRRHVTINPQDYTNLNPSSDEIITTVTFTVENELGESVTKSIYAYQYTLDINTRSPIPPFFKGRPILSY